MHRINSTRGHVTLCLTIGLTKSHPTDTSSQVSEALSHHLSRRLLQHEAMTLWLALTSKRVGVCVCPCLCPRLILSAETHRGPTPSDSTNTVLISESFWWENHCRDFYGPFIKSRRRETNSRHGLRPVRHESTFSCCGRRRRQKSIEMRQMAKVTYESYIYFCLIKTFKKKKKNLVFTQSGPKLILPDQITIRQFN